MEIEEGEIIESPKSPINPLPEEPSMDSETSKSNVKMNPNDSGNGCGNRGVIPALLL